MHVDEILEMLQCKTMLELIKCAYVGAHTYCKPTQAKCNMESRTVTRHKERKVPQYFDKRGEDFNSCKTKIIEKNIPQPGSSVYNFKSRAFSNKC